MIEARELRIGNFVLENGDIVQVDAGLFYWLINQNHGKPSTFTQIEPIPLTPEKLEKAGFGLLDRWAEKKDIILLEIEKIYTFHYSIQSGRRVYLRYVHQLQNLFYTLTGEELTINL